MSPSKLYTCVYCGDYRDIYIKCWHVIISQQMLAATVIIIIIIIINILTYLPPVLSSELSEGRL